MIAAALRLVPLALLQVAAAPQTPTQKLSIRVAGPLLLVDVTRTLTAEGDGNGRGERVLDLALPEGARFVDAQLNDGAGKRAWRTIAPKDAAGAQAAYVARRQARGFPPTPEAFDDAADVRVRVAPLIGDAKRPIGLRYRYVVPVTPVNGWWRVRFPAPVDRAPPAPEVSVLGHDASEVEIAGVRAEKVTAPARAAWELAWSSPKRRPHAFDVTRVHDLGKPQLVALTIEAEGAPVRPPPERVLFVIDRSRSVGIAGAAIERDLARKLLEALPPATRFEALFFDHEVTPLFHTFRGATRDALAGLEAALLPDRLRNGTDLPGALHAAGELLRREGATAERTLVVVSTDGALPDEATAESLDAAFGAVPAAEVAAFVVRPVDDAAAQPAVVAALGGFAARHAGLARAPRANELDATIAAALDALARGGDVTDVRVGRDAHGRLLATSLAPGESRFVAFAASGADVGSVSAISGRERVTVTRGGSTIDAAWLRPLVSGETPTRLLETDALVALVEPVDPKLRVERAPEPVVRGALDREVVRNTLALAYLPRARACYLGRTGKTAAERDLAGRVRIAIDLARGEVGRAVVESSTLAAPTIEACLREAALALDVPRALRNDFPATAVLNLVFRPYTPEKATTPDEAALGAKIDLVIEELHRTQQPSVDEPPQTDRSMVPTR
ncbi:MAG TPA: hypothetical protein VHJ20_02405 [Polyangia bacterium]|nr:hypothetical protein [Polyangia bacterium]